MKEVYEIYDAECIAESKSGDSILVDAPMFDEYEYVSKKAIADNSEVADVGDSGTLIVYRWFATMKRWA